MSVNEKYYEALYGAIEEKGEISSARCACVACNSCTCACSCRQSSDFEVIEW